MSQDAHWFLTERFVLRVAGLPVDELDRLRTPASTRWAEELLSLREELVRRKAAVGDALEAAVADNADESARRALLALRRDVFNLRRPRDPAAARRLAAGLDPPDAASAGEWLELRERLEERRAAGDAILAGELEECRSHLRDLARDPRLRLGLLLASPSLDRYLSSYLDAPSGTLSKRARGIERSLLEYVFRTACKTSPFSTLTAVALGRFVASGGWALEAAGEVGVARSHTRLNLAALARLADAVIGDARLRDDLPVEISSGWRADSDRIRYVRRMWVAGDDAAPMTFDALQETLFYLSRGTILKELLAIMEERPRLAAGELADRLRRADPEHRESVEVDAYLRQLLRLGLLTVPQLHVDIHGDDPVRGFQDGIAGLRQTWSDAVVERLDRVVSQVADYARVDLAGRRRVLAAIRTELTEAQCELGVPEARIPQTVVYEDVSLPEIGAVASREHWQAGLLPALRGLARILPVFDTTLPHQLTLNGFFRARYGRVGRCEDVLSFVHDFHQDIYDQYLRVSFRRRIFDAAGEFLPQPNWLRMPEIDALDSARRELVRRMREAFAGLPEAGGELVLDDDFMDAVAAELPADIRDVDSRTFFLQVADDGGEPLGVLNRCYSGLSFMFSRFAHCFADADADAGDRGLADDLRRSLADAQPPGAVFAELTGGYDTTNLNLHPPVTQYELVCPGEISFRPPAQQIPIDDLDVVHDDGRDRVCLRSRRLGVEVIPLYLGYLMPMALPEMQRALLLFSPTSMAMLDLWNGVDKPLVPGTIGGHPRVRYRNLVLARRAWKMHPDYLPQRHSGDCDADWFLAWQRWRVENQLPRRVFAAIDAADPGDPAEGGEDNDRGGRRGKPQYADFDSYFSLSLLDQMARTADRRVVMTEMLPDLDQLWLRSGGGGYVAEQTIELTRLSRPPRQPHLMWPVNR